MEDARRNRWRTTVMKVVAAIGGIGLAMGVMAVPTPAGAAGAPNDIGYQGSAFGTLVTGNLGGLGQAGSGRSALSVVNCTVRPGLHDHNATAGVTLPGNLGTVGAITDNSATSVYRGHAISQSSSRIGSISLLGGAVSAQAVATSVLAREQETGSGHSFHASSRLVGLQVEGKSFPASVPPNTTLPLPGLGQVVLNWQNSGSKPGTPVFVGVAALRVTITVPSNPLGLPAGLTVVVARGYAGLSGPQVGKVGHVAYGTSATHGSVTSNKTFPEFLSCFGTGGHTLTNTGANVGMGPLSAAAVRDAVSGVDTKGQPLQARLSATVAGVKIGTIPSVPLPIPAILSANVVRAAAYSSTADGHTTQGEQGSQIGGLTIFGFPVPTQLPPENTVVPLPNVGILYLNRVSTKGSSIEVRMIELKVTNQALAAALGSPDISIGVAQARS